MPRSNAGQDAHVSPTPRVTSHKANIMRRTREAACWFRLGCWGNNVANSHLALGHSTAEYMRSSLVPQCSQRLTDRVVNNALRSVTRCLHLTPAEKFPIIAGIQPAELRRKIATLSLTRRAMEPGHLLHSALTSSPSGNSRRLQLRHPFVPAAQFINSFDDNNISAALWVVTEEYGVVGEHCKTPYAHPRHRHSPSCNGPAKNNVGPA